MEMVVSIVDFYFVKLEGIQVVFYQMRKIRYYYEGINGWIYFNDRVVFLVKYVIII